MMPHTESIMIRDGKFVKHNTMWTDNEKSILSSHVNRISFRDISQMLPGLTVDAIKQRCQLLGLFRTGKRFSGLQRDEQFFAVPNQICSYWAGFIAADGCVITHPRREVRIGLNKKDEDRLIRFIKDTRYMGSVGGSSFSNVTVCAADQWIYDLARVFNVGPKKTHTLQLPPICGENALSYSVGYIDGDGCWHRDKSDGRLHLIVVGTKELLEWLDETWSSNGAMVGRTTIGHQFGNGKVGIARRAWSGRFAESIARLLWNLDVPHMNRKWSIAMKGVKGTQ